MNEMTRNRNMNYLCFPRQMPIHNFHDVYYIGTNITINCVILNVAVITYNLE
jgi:hypothetical protein